jgi:Xaa-Pro aminopeptidase
MDYLELEHAKIAAAIPQWADVVARAELKQQIRDHGKSLGYSDEALDSVVDSRAVILAYRSMKRGQEIAADRAAQDAAQRAAETAARKREAQHLVAKAAESHRARDAAEALKMMIPD